MSICNYIDMEKNEILKIFGKNLRAERNRAGYSQDELAEKSDLSATAFGAIERGTSAAGIDTLERIAIALGIELKELVDVSKIDLD